MRAPSALLVLALLASPVGAQTVTIRSGEHETFTRLVLAIPEGADWRLGRIAEGYGLRLDVQELDYDPRGVFERLPRNRIAELTPLGSELRLTFNCECHMHAFLWRPDRLVLDIRDGPAPADWPFEAPLGPLPDAAPQRAMATRESVLPLFLDPPPPQEEAPLFFAPSLPENAPPVVADSAEPPLAATEQALLESIARAASQGLLSPAAALPDILGDQSEPERPQPEPEPIPPLVTAPDRPGITARTSIDRDLAENLPDIAAATGGCLPADRVDIAAWAEPGTPFHLQIARHRRALVGEFDRISDDAPRDLARTYIHFGFGREALQALTLGADPLARDPVLAEMAALVDGNRPTHSLLADQVGCPGAVGLWAVLAREEIPARPVIDRNGILQAFGQLPRHLRGHLGAALAGRFLAYGDTDAADFLLRAMGEEASKSEAAELAAAEIALQRGELGEVLEQLIARARKDVHASPDLLLRVFELSREAGRAVPSDLIELSAALRFSLRTDPRAIALAEAEARALIDGGAYPKAFALIDESKTGLTQATALTLRSEAVKALSSDLPDLAFLRAALGDLPRPIDAAAENALAARLLELGFPEAALSAFEAQATRTDAAERRYLRAQAALALDRPEEVGNILTAMTDPRAAALRSAALAAMEDYAGALSMVPDRPEEGNPEAAWRAGAWVQLADSDDPTLRAASERALAAAMAAPPQQPILTAEAAPLRSGHALLEDAADARALIADLLTRFSIEPAVAPAPAVAARSD